MSEVRQKLIVGIFSSVFADKSKYCQNQSLQPFFLLDRRIPPARQTRSKNDGSGYKAWAWDGISKSFMEPRNRSQSGGPVQQATLFVGPARQTT